jgi:AsmA protein
LGIIVAGGAALYYAAIRALDPAVLTAELEKAVHRATGRDLAITGPVHLRIGLAPSFIVEGVTLSNIPGGSRPAMLTARSLRADVALLPLLGGDAVVESMTVVQPDILLERTADGTPNWIFTPVRRALFQGTPADPASSGGGTHVEIHTLHVEGGQLTWQPRAGTPLVLAIDSLTATSQDAASPLKIDVSLEHDGAPLTVHAVTGSLDRLQGGPVSAMAGAWPLTIQAQAGDASLKLDGGIAHPDQARGYVFAVTGAIPDVGAIAPYFPDLSLPPLKEVTLAARLTDGTTGDVRTSQLTLHAGAANLSTWAAGLSVADASISAPGPGQNMQLSVDGTYAGAPLHLAGTAMQPDLLSQNAPIAATLTGQAGNADISAKGTIPPSLGASGLDLVVSAHAPDLSELSALFGRALPPARDLQFDAHAEDAGFKLRGVTLRGLTLTSSVAQLQGTVTVLWTPRFALNGTIAAGQIDLDTLLPDVSLADVVWAPATPAPASAAPPPAPAVPPLTQAEPAPPRLISDRPLNLAPLRSADADLTLSAASMTAGGEQYRDISGHLSLSGGKAALNPFRFAVQSGVLIGGASVDASTDQPPIAVTVRASGFPASLLASLAGVPDGASGAVQLDLQLSGVGQTAQALASTLDGHAGLAMVNGEVDGALVQPLLGETLAAAGIPAFDVGKSGVRCLAVRAEFAHGIGTLRALAADTQRLSLDGSGDIDLASETLDLHLNPSLRAGPIAASAPISLSGPLAAPKAALDPVLGGGRVGFSIGGAGDPSMQTSDCAAKLAIARGGAPGPMPAATAQQGQVPFSIKKPKDLLQGLFH